MELDSGLGLDCKEFEGITCVLIMWMSNKCQPLLILISVVLSRKYQFLMLSHLDEMCKSIVPTFPPHHSAVLAPKGLIKHM